MRPKASQHPKAYTHLIKGSNALPPAFAFSNTSDNQSWFSAKSKHCTSLLNSFPLDFFFFLGEVCTPTHTHPQKKTPQK